MKAQTYHAGPGVLFILVGIMLAFVSALLPHFHTGYNLNIGVLAAGLAPWLVYGVAVPLLRHPVTLVAGLLLALIHGWLVFSERFSAGMPYADDTIYRYPLILAVLLLPLAYAAVRLDQKRMMTPQRKHKAEET